MLLLLHNKDSNQLDRTTSTTANHLNVGSQLAHPHVNRSEAMVGWLTPVYGRFKCNMDASFSNQLNRTGIGICIRDETGTFVLAKSIHISPMCLDAAGEALALFYALEWLSDMVFDNVDFSSDSKVIIDAFHKNKIDVTKIGCILSACKILFSSQFTKLNSRVSQRTRQYGSSYPSGNCPIIS